MAAHDDDFANPPVRGPNKKELAADRAAARQSDKAMGDAYDAAGADHGAGTPGAHRPTDEALGTVYDGGLVDARKEGPAGRAGPGGGAGTGGPRGGGRSGGSAGRAGPGSSGPGRPSGVGESGAGVIIGMVGYAIAINYLRGGYPAVRGWFAAKFLNKPYQGALNVAGPPVGVAPLAPAASTSATSSGSGQVVV